MNGAAGTSRDPLLQPLRIRHLTLRNRVMSTSHAAGLEEDGMPAERYQRYHEEKARGGIGLTMFGGSSNVAPDSPNVFRQLNVGDDRIVPYFRSFSERVHAQGAALMCQITHLGRRGDSQLDGWLPTIAPSRVREILHRNFPREMDEYDIARVVQAYGDAAARCRDGGLDGLETVAGGHLIGQFFAPDSNKRTDRFGGSVENRARFALLVHEEIRRRVGRDFLVGIRLSVDEGLEGGVTFEDAVAIAKLLQESGSIDFFNANYGRMDTEIALAMHNMPGFASPIAPHLDAVGRFKRAVSLPVFHAGRILDVATARRAIRDGHVDMVGMTRAHIADPQLVNKLARGEEDRIRPCIGASHCIYKKPSCIHNPASGRETELPQRIERAAATGRKIVIVGGGPGGLEAARVSAERGHDVVLFEAAAQLGGQIRTAIRAAMRRDLVAIVDWRVAELERLGVRVETNRYATQADVRAENPAIVIVATGGLPDLDWLDGAEHATSVWDVLDGAAATAGAAQDVLVFDGTGRHEALAVADQLADAGCKVAMATRDERVAIEMSYVERVVWRKRLYERGIELLFDQGLTKVERHNNRLRATLVNELTGATTHRVADRIVVEHGTAPVDELFHALRAESANDGVTDIGALLAGAHQPKASRNGAFELYRIGDAVASRSIHAAIYDALRLCNTL
jgi:2,4-dienoyl-CoA reductase-like NADH-dependent reductase (Old Yellow Enzyme family)/pyruvate/2-oxoglutarate dehydrogenase complex dihydrolipoamide dehydrogenase (E3) component